MLTAGLTREQAEQIAFELVQKTSAAVAFLVDGSVGYFSHGDSPVISLIQAVYDHHPEQARRILRSRIYGTAPPTDACRGMLKVAAKRLTAPIEPTDRKLAHSFRLQEIAPFDPPPLLSLEELSSEARDLVKLGRIMEAAFEIAGEIPRRPHLYESDRRVAAILISEDGDFLAASRNENAKNRTRHAETNLVQGFLRERKAKLPRGSCLYVTLKCCKMCAAMIAGASADLASVRVFFGEDDPGPNARNTVLGRLNLETFLAPARVLYPQKP